MRVVIAGSAPEDSGILEKQVKRDTLAQMSDTLIWVDMSHTLLYTMYNS